MVLVYFACVLLIYGVRMMVYIIFLDFAFTVLSHGSGKVLPKPEKFRARTLPLLKPCDSYHIAPDGK